MDRAVHDPGTTTISLSLCASVSPCLRERPLGLSTGRLGSSVSLAPSEWVTELLSESTMPTPEQGQKLLRNAPIPCRNNAELPPFWCTNALKRPPIRTSTRDPVDSASIVQPVIPSQSRGKRHDRTAAIRHESARKGAMERTTCTRIVVECALRVHFVGSNAPWETANRRRNCWIPDFTGMTESSARLLRSGILDALDHARRTPAVRLATATHPRAQPITTELTGDG